MTACPSGKVRHPSQAAAKAAATAVGHRRTHDRPRVYQCPDCAGWHMTTAPKARQPIVTTAARPRRHGRGKGSIPAPHPASPAEVDAWFAAHTPPGCAS